MRAWALLAVVLCGCSRAVSPVPPEPTATQQCTPSSGGAPLRRLTGDEFDATASALLGLPSSRGHLFPPDEGLGFSNAAAAQSPSALLSQRQLEAAEQLAEAADLPALLPCPVNDDCAASFIAQFGRRAYRRPLTSEEATRLLEFYQATRTSEDVDTSYRMMLQVFLQSPEVLYRLEPRASDAMVALSGAAVATRLSYFLWGSTPDDALLEAAATGALDTREGVATQARRLLADPRAREGVRRFHVEWLGVNHLDAATKTDPSFDVLKPDLKEEVARFGEWATLDDGQVSQLFTGRVTFLNEALAAVYGLDGVTGPEFRRVDLRHKERAGVLTLPGVLATWAKADQTSPVLRGRLVRERLLCQALPTPPANVMVTLPPPTQGTTRERFSAHVRDPACSGCHQLMDPLGFGFEKYDAVGAFRLVENGKVIDARGQVLGTSDADGTFDGALELGARLAASSDVKRCVVTQWFRFATGRAETELDACALQEAVAALDAAHGDLREMLVALAASDAVRLAPGATP